MRGSGGRLREADPAAYECLLHAKLLVLTGGRYPDGDLTAGGFSRVLEWLAGTGILERVIRSPGL